MTRLSSLGLALGLMCAGAGYPPAFAASAIPDFSSDSVMGWVAGVPDSLNPVGQEFIPPASGPGPVTNDPRYPYIDSAAGRREGKTPTLRIADLSNPILQPWVREALGKVNERALASSASGIMPTPKERCWPIGVPGWLLYPVTPIYLVQTAKEVTMIWMEDHMVRHVYLDVPHTEHPKSSWFGESVGHYENGDTLVVDTIGLNARTFVDSFRTPHTEQLHVIERYRLVDGGKGIEVLVHVEDPGAFTTPWAAMQKYRRVTQPLGEQTCAENNARYFNYDVEPIPTAERPDF